MSQIEQTLPNAALSSTPLPKGWGVSLAYFFLNRTPLGKLVRWVAGIKSSVHVKLVTGFFIVILLFVAMGALSLQATNTVSQQSTLLEQAHKRVEWSRQIQHALALQMNFTAMALLLRDEVTVEKILRENNRFNNTLALIAEAAVPEEQQIIQRIRVAQEEALSAVADIANLLRDKKVDDAMNLQLGKGYPLYEKIAGLVDQVVAGRLAVDYQEGDGYIDNITVGGDANPRRASTVRGKLLYRTPAQALMACCRSVAPRGVSRMAACARCTTLAIFKMSCSVTPPSEKAAQVRAMAASSTGDTCPRLMRISSQSAKARAARIHSGAVGGSDSRIARTSRSMRFACTTRISSRGRAASARRPSRGCSPRP